MTWVLEPAQVSVWISPRVTLSFGDTVTVGVRGRLRIRGQDLVHL